MRLKLDENLDVRLAASLRLAMTSTPSSMNTSAAPSTPPSSRRPGQSCARW